ncbi:hypothetical protein BH09ACT1_BH09ACT1_08830 [soil metagenome]
MNRRVKRRMPRRRAALTLFGALAIAGIVIGAGGPTMAADDPGGTGQVDIGVSVPSATANGITNAQLRWGLNRESSSGSFFGGCNFLSAGRAADAGSGRVWTAGDGLYSASSGAVTIIKATSAGGWARASFDSRCLDPQGTPVSVNSTTVSSQTQVMIDGGTGNRTAEGGVRIAWSGSFTVAFYGGLTYWSATDPVLTLDASGNGQLTASASGYGTSMEDATKWVPLAPRTIVLAEIRGAAVNAGGFSTIPAYLGVASAGAGQVALTAVNARYWGSFPQSFIDFQTLTGQTGYWLSTGGQRDPAKPATSLTINYDAAAPIVVPAVEGSIVTNPTPSNPLVFRPDVPAAAAATTPTIAGGTPMQVSRDDGTGLVPQAAASGVSALLLPLGGTVLALLVSALSVLQLNGRLRLPWGRKRA